MDKARQGSLFPDQELAGEQAVAINERCQVLTCGQDRTVMVMGVAVAHFRAGDRAGETHAMLSLVRLGHARQIEVSRAFRCSDRSVRRYQQRFEEGGLAALGRPAGYPSGRPRLQASRISEVERLKAEGESNRRIAMRLGVDEKGIRKLLKRLGWKGAGPHQACLPGLEEDADPYLSGQGGVPVQTPSTPRAGPYGRGEAPSQGADPNLSAVQPETLEVAQAAFSFSLDKNPQCRSMDRMLAYQGLISDALPLFASGAGIQQAGVLLAVPLILASGVLDGADEVYGSIGPAFHGLRTTLMTFLLMSLLRIKRPEGLKERSPQAMGRVLGLDRAMEVKTLRAKLKRLASMGRAAAFGQALAKRRIALHGKTLGFLYVDGHVRVYSGKQDLPKAHVTRLRIALPATTDYFVNDERGDPLFVVTAPANAGLTSMLPRTVAEARELIPERRLTVVFDRGGYCFDLFKRLIADRVDILTYRKGAHDPVPEHSFIEETYEASGLTYIYRLADQEVSLCEGLTVRQVTRLCEGGHQTTILTSRRDLPAAEVAFRMFERWRQENFFKYMREEFALDALVDYDTEPDDATREVPNPVWRERDAKLRKAKAEFERLCAHVGLVTGLDTFPDEESLRAILKPKKSKKAARVALGQDILKAARHVMECQKARDAAPRRVPIAQVSKGEVRKLDCERKHLTTVLKMTAYRIESDLFRMLEPFYARNEDEGRTLIQSAFNTSADLEVTDTELRVTLAPLSSPHRTKAIANLCQELNQAPARYPGTNLTLSFQVAGQQPKTGQV